MLGAPAEPLAQVVRQGPEPLDGKMNKDGVGISSKTVSKELPS
jgi:hypothetical protein